MVRTDSEPLGPFVQADEALVGGKGGPNKELVLVATEANGRVRLAHASNNDAGTLKRFADGQIAPNAHVVTDGHAGYSDRSLGERSHAAIVQTKAERRDNDMVQSCHWTISQLKRWLMGTHAGAVSDKHLQAYLDEFVFRHNRRKTRGVGRIAARVIEGLIAQPAMTMRRLIDGTRRCRWFNSAHTNVA
jgi:transposase-like protein